MRASAFLNARLVLPPGAANEAVTTDVAFAQDATVWGLFPHTHVRGKRWSYVLMLPDGTSTPILSVPKYDFNWQTYYLFKEPLQVPKGARIVSTAWYDNSKANRFNPDPSRRGALGRSDLGGDAVHRHPVLRTHATAIAQAAAAVCGRRRPPGMLPGFAAAQERLAC